MKLTFLLVQDRSSNLPQLGGAALQGFRSSLSEPKYEYQPHASSAAPRVVPAEGKSNPLVVFIHSELL